MASNNSYGITQQGPVTNVHSVLYTRSPAHQERIKWLPGIHLCPLGRASSSCHLLLPYQLTYLMFHSRANSHCLICLGKMFTHTSFPHTVWATINDTNDSLMHIPKEQVRFIHTFLNQFFKWKNHTWKAEMIQSFFSKALTSCKMQTQSPQGSAYNTVFITKCAISQI